jgi:hypothetical protein
MTWLSDIKLVIRDSFPIISGGPINIARSKSTIKVMDMLAEKADAAAGAGFSFAPIEAAEVIPASAGIVGLDLRKAVLWLANRAIPNVVAVPKPSAPTGGVVDDTGDTFSFLPTAAYPSFAQYMVAGLPGITGAVALDAVNSYVQGGRIYIKVVGAVAKGGLAVYVAGSGSIPDGQVLTNAEPFTGVVVTPPVTTNPSAALTAALAISVASIVAGSPLTFTVTAGGGTAPYSYAVTATNNATGAVTVLGSSASGSFTPQTAGVSYDINATVTDAAGNTKQATTRTVQVTAAQSTNQLPVVSVGDHLTITEPTTSAVLMATASDPDAGDTLTYVWRPISGPNTPTGLPASTLNVVVSNLVVGEYVFGFQATDNHGGKSAEGFVALTKNAAQTPTGQPYTITPGTTDYSQNANIADVQSSGFTRHASLAFLDYDVNAETSVDLTFESNGANRSFLVTLDGQLAQRVVQASAGTQLYTIPLTGSGTRRMRVQLEGCDRDFEQGDIIGPSIKSLAFAGLGYTNLVKTSAPEVVIGFGDSIMSGAIATVIGLEAYGVLLRTASRAFIASSYGSHTAAVAFGSTSARIKAVAECTAAFSAANTVKWVVIWLGTNDYDFATGTPAAAALGIAQGIDAIHAKFSDAKILLVTSLTRYDKTGARGGYTLQDYRDAQGQILSGRQNFVRLLDGTNLVPQSQLAADQLHPATSGHATIAATLKAQLDNRTFPAASGSILVPTSASVRNPLPSGMAAEWLPAKGRKTTLVGNTLTHTSGTANGWNSFAPSRALVDSPPATFEGEYLRIRFPNLTRATSAVVVGFATTPSVADESQTQGMLLDNQVLALTSSGRLVNLVCYGNMTTGEGYMRLCASSDATNTALTGDIPGVPAFPFYILGFTYGDPGWDAGMGVSTLDGVTLLSNYLKEAF